MGKGPEGQGVMKYKMSGNTAVAYGALKAGIAVAAGYPGTPSSEVITELLSFAQANAVAPYVEWSTNEKVALEVAVGAAWAGQRALVTMKMSGANVALDTLISVGYSGTKGGLVVFVADDPGAEAGMPEQDTRVMAQLVNLPVLEPANPIQAYELIQTAFELSEHIELPVILRSVTTLSHGIEYFEIEQEYRPLKRTAHFTRDIARFTKAGAEICLNQHLALLERNTHALDYFQQHGLNSIVPPDGEGSGMAIISVGVINQIVAELQPFFSSLTVVRMHAVLPVDLQLFAQIFDTHSAVLVLEELEPIIETELRSLAQRTGWEGRVVGVAEDLLPRVGRYTREVVLRGIAALTEEQLPQDVLTPVFGSEERTDEPAMHIKHPITFCEGCPHRGTYMALNQALRKTGFGMKETVVTGDIGCTILGMNPPFNSCWTEISMGSSIGLAQGFNRAGIRNPVVATIGDSTFFHGGIPQLVNAVQHRAELLLIILDNGWTSMTGFQVNPGTGTEYQQGQGRRVEIDRIVEAIGVDMLEVMDPFQQDAAVKTVSAALTASGVRVVISRAECALTRMRREPVRTRYRIDPQACTYCKACILQTGCPALFIEDSGKTQTVRIDQHICTGCALCAHTCRFDAIHLEGAGE